MAAYNDAAEVINLFLDSNSPAAFVVTTTATAEGGGDRTSGYATIAAHASARLPGEFCDVAAVGLLARGSGGFSDAGATSTGEVRAWGNACLPRGLTFNASQLNEPDPNATNPSALVFPSTTTLSVFPLRLSAHVALNATPSFGSMRNDPFRTFSETAYGIGTEGARLSLQSPDRGVSFIYMNLAQRWEWAGLPQSGEAGYELSMQFGFFRWFRVRDRNALADRSIDVLDIKLHGVRFARSAGLLELAPVRINGLSLGSDELLADVSVGLGASGARIESSDAGTVMNSDDVPKVTTWVGKVGVSQGTQAQDVGVQFVRTLDSSVAADLALENRLTAWATLAQPDLRGRLEVFGGSAKHYFDLTTAGQERFMGLTANVDYAVRHDLWLGLRGEGVSSFARDAPLEGRIAPSGFRGLLTLTWSRDLVN
ncbi:MAG TPA: hypothetical protein PLF40_31840, partial [Kofleriaceae bacterium]|nr:hypothetical protein [Kofleriaceae bacterium]